MDHSHSINPVNPSYFSDSLTLRASTLTFGTILNGDNLLSLQEVKSSTRRDILFRLNMRHRELQVFFDLRFQDWRSRNWVSPDPKQLSNNRIEQFKFTLPLPQLVEVSESPVDGNRFAWLITLKTPPRYFKKVEDPASGLEAWFRQTDVVYNPGSLRHTPVALKKDHPILDLGRWLSYRFVFDMENNNARALIEIRRILDEHNIRIVHGRGPRILHKEPESIFDYIDHSPEKDSDSPNGFQRLWDDPTTSLAFNVRYQLEVCISHGYLNEFAMGLQFVEKLQSMDPQLAQNLLEFIANQNKEVKDPMSIFDLKAVSGTTSATQIPVYCALVRSAIVTPTTIYFNTPQVETSNRVIRHYGNWKDRFLRVRISDERAEVGKLFLWA